MQANTCSQRLIVLCTCDHKRTRDWTPGIVTNGFDVRKNSIFELKYLGNTDILPGIQVGDLRPGNKRELLKSMPMGMGNLSNAMKSAVYRFVSLILLESAPKSTVSHAK
jgi:hypothetical protein